jgi:hypothetical protein
VYVSELKPCEGLAHAATSMLASFYGLLLQVRLKTLLGLPILLRKSPHIEEPSGFFGCF